MKLVLISLLIISAIATPDYGLPSDFKLDNKEKGFKQTTFSNVLDHFNPGDDRTYEQRFWYSSEGFDEKKGPIFVYICGEYECGVQEERMFPYNVSREWKASFFFVEHRFYGESQPFKNLATDNLRYLTSRHALADLALFISEVNKKLISEFGGEKRKVIVVGGSYPGALSAWFREKYPHIADASWASSAVIKAIEDYDMFDYQVYNSTTRSNLYCTGTVENLTVVYDRLVDQGNKDEVNKIKKSCNASGLTDADFAFYFADVITISVQYGGRTELCDFLESLAGVDILEQYGKIAEYAKDEVSASEYDRKQLKSTKIIPSNPGRAWTYQYCSEFGFFQIPYKSVMMRSKLLEHEYWVDLCHDVFGQNLVASQARDSNIYYGSDHAKGSNIYFVNGGEDPWQWAGQLESIKSQNVQSDLLQCVDCGHCVELYNEKDTDPIEVKKTRSNIKAWLKKILKSSHSMD